jgi:hypothetical protein
MGDIRHYGLPGLCLGSLAGNQMTPRYDPRLFPRTGGHRLPRQRAVRAYRGTLQAYLVFSLAYLFILTLVVMS